LHEETDRILILANVTEGLAGELARVIRELDELIKADALAQAAFSEEPVTALDPAEALLDIDLSPDFVGCEEQFRQIVALRFDTSKGVSLFITDEWEARYICMDVCDAVCGYYEFIRPCHETRIRMSLMWDDSKRLHNELSRIISQDRRPVLLANAMELALLLQRELQLIEHVPAC
jgi:hypothetical protein